MKMKEMGDKLEALNGRLIIVMYETRDNGKCVILVETISLMTDTY